MKFKTYTSILTLSKKNRTYFERFHKGGYLKNFDIKRNNNQLFNHNFTRIKNFDKLYYNYSNDTSPHISVENRFIAEKDKRVLIHIFEKKFAAWLYNGNNFVQCK